MIHFSSDTGAQEGLHYLKEEMLGRNIFQWRLPVLKTFIATALSSVLALTNSFFLTFNVEFMLN